MLILALDNTTRAGSCALARDGRVLRERPGDPSREPASRLPGELVALLDEQSIELKDVQVYAVATGPGSFTGLRIGIATMQGLAFAAGKPLIGISGFDALAAAAGEAERIATWVDAWRGEVYAALYDAGREAEPPTVEKPEAVLARLKGVPTTFVGDGAVIHHDLIRSTLGSHARFAEPVVPLLAGTIATLAAATARAGHLPPPHAIRPLYVRRPDVELAKAAGPQPSSR